MVTKASAIDLNNNAIAFLQAGKSHEAMVLFRRSLTELKEKLGPSENPESPSSATKKSLVPTLPSFERTSSARWLWREDSTRSLTCSEYDEDDTMDLDLASSLSHETIPVLVPLQLCSFSSPEDDSFVTMYNRALLIDETAIEEVNQELVTCVVVYNMAVVYHVHGIQKGISDFLTRALRLYQMASGIMEKQLGVSSPTSLLLMAIWNNVAHVHSQLFSLHNMQRSLSQLRVLLAAVHDDGSYGEVDEADYVIFFMNAMFTSTTDVVVAPAA